MKLLIAACGAVLAVAGCTAGSTVTTTVTKTVTETVGPNGAATISGVPQLNVQPSSNAAAPSTPNDTSVGTGSTVTVKSTGSDGSDTAAQVTVLPAVVKPSVLAAPHEHLVGYEVTIVGASGKFDVNPTFFSAQNAAGDTYQTALGDYDGELTDTTLTAGRRIRGLIAFNVPRGQKIASVSLNDPLGSPLHTWSAG
ncbi:MAG: DUF4352 domain-containing protein [Jatrophihabitans sp.]|uniref:DUF4352 domain-containing protein n=1 Tax=Jatrophihabitans sp. TaxID=1932789 RepID=UPI003F7EA9D1